MKFNQYECFVLYELFFVLYRNIKKALQQFIMNEQSSGNPTWLCSLPLYHFLHGKLRPYEEMNKRTDHYAEKPLWWGKDDFERQMNLLKGRTKWSMYVYLHYHIRIRRTKLVMKCQGSILISLNQLT